MTELPLWSLGTILQLAIASQYGLPCARVRRLRGIVLFGLALRLHRLRFELVGAAIPVTPV